MACLWINTIKLKQFGLADHQSQAILMTFPKDNWWGKRRRKRKLQQEVSLNAKRQYSDIPCCLETEWTKLPSIASLAINSAHMQKHHAQLTVNLKFVAHCSPRTTFGLFPSGYPSVSLPGKREKYFRRFLDLAGDLWIRFISQKSNHGIVQNLFWTRKLDKWRKTFRKPFRENPLPLPGSFRDCGILQCQKTARKHLDK